MSYHNKVIRDRVERRQMIRERYEENLDLFEQTPEGERECIQFTADALGISKSEVVKAL